MNIGMLWYDDSPLDLKLRIEKAAEYYVEKYGHKPNLVVVHPSMLETEELRLNGVLVRRGPSVRPGHFWIGVDDEPGETRQPARAAGKRRVAKQAKPPGRKPRAASRKKPSLKRGTRG
ncbi:MAG: hypothetical protein ACRDHG_09980 [Anaerolineales bacterium]